MEEKKVALTRLSRCDFSGKFISKMFPSAKEFGIEGCEALIPGLLAMFEVAAHQGVEDIEMGMSHRGRVNVLHEVFRKPLHSIINAYKESELSSIGDVKYHLGTRAELSVVSSDGVERVLGLSLEANPSHLEAVNPVVIGKVRAKQYFNKDETRQKVMPLLLHGDAAFSGQGIVPEVMEVSWVYFDIVPTLSPRSILYL
jgi:2-oxoglutarate dehydrogenase E1 component